MALILAIQLLPDYSASAVTPGDVLDLTGTEYLVVHPTDYDPPSQASSLTITQADGITPILPDASGNIRTFRPA